LDKQQLLKRIKKAGAAVYSNGEKYSDEHLATASEVRVDLSSLANQDKMSKAYDEIIKTKTIDSKFDNVYFNVKGARLPHFLTGDMEIQDCGIHLQPLTYETKKSVMYTLLMTDFRFYGKAVMSRSYLMFADVTGLHIMPEVDNAAAKAGCVCYAKNPFNNANDFALKLKERMPCFALDIGFALPGCKATAAGCDATVSHVPSAAQTVKVLLAYLNLPTNYILRVDNHRVRNGKPQKVGKPYYVVVDSTQIEKIVRGDKMAETRGNSFTDGALLTDVMNNDKRPLAVESFNVNTTTYTVLQS
jgi:hypothetical protein